MNKKLAEVLSEKEMPFNFMRFYAVGLVLFIIPFTREFFISVIALSLLLVIGTVLCYHRNWNVRTVVYFAFIYVSSFLLEMKGTATGDIFGAYYYDRGLGIQINNTPLIIGLNWLFLVYASHDIAASTSRSPLMRILIGAVLMVLYDVLLEWVAPPMQMWHFDTYYPPIENFLVWFMASLVFHSGFELLHIKTNNRPAGSLFFIQAGLFVLIGLFSSIFIR